MNIQFVKTSPTQNVTILVESAVSRENQPQMAERLLEYDGVGGEQVGFLEESRIARIRLQMMGGEFCGNASMATGAYLAWKDSLADGASTEYPLEVSGAKEIVRVGITRSGKDYLGCVEIPGAERIESAELQTDCGEISAKAVFLPGITHLVLPAESGITAEEIERRIRTWNETFKADALGALIYDSTHSVITPVVYVPASNTIVRERGCGSGTAAIGCLNAQSSGFYSGDIRQPGGTIRVTARKIDQKFTVQIEGTVKITASGIAYL